MWRASQRRTCKRRRSDTEIEQQSSHPTRSLVVVVECSMRRVSYGVGKFTLTRRRDMMNSRKAPWMLIHMEVGERKLDFYALQSSFACRLNHTDNLYCTNAGTQPTFSLPLLPRPFGAPTLRAPPVYVKPAATPFLYKPLKVGTKTSRSALCRGPRFRIETHWESDDEEERGDNEIFSPISTKAGQELGSILLVAPGTPSCELKSAYKLQLSVRVDEKRLALV